MDAWLTSRTSQYLFVFVATGLVAVAVKICGDLSQGRLAGIVATMPVKIIAAWAILAAYSGSRGIVDSIAGMLIGLTAILGMVLAVRVLAGSVAPPVLIAFGLAVWATVVASIQLAVSSLGR